MQCVDFTHRIICPARHVEKAAQVVLHTICFHRFLGTIKPAYVDVLGSTFPAIADVQVDQLIRHRASQLTSLSASTKSVSLTIYFLHPSSKIPSAIQSSSKSTAATNEPTSDSGAGDQPSGMINTATHAASSLRSWASSRNYQYGWLAHAFSSGAGQPSGTFVPSPPAVQDSEGLEDLHREAFERWEIVFEKAQDGDGRDGMKEELEVFVGRVLGFVGANKSHLPGTASAELCPFPMQIVVRKSE
ncbi:Autophagy-related protein 101 [Pseudozyma hubeiensis]|nr:Autophagy-related protein 101 [Pseudozyma hubeiensis]